MPDYLRELTDEERASVPLSVADMANLSLYGWCAECQAPREARQETRTEGKVTITTMRLVCPYGHSQD